MSKLVSASDSDARKQSRVVQQSDLGTWSGQGRLLWEGDTEAKKEPTL